MSEKSKKRGWVIKNARNLYLVKVVLPVSKINGEECMWSSRIQDAVDWNDYGFACALGDLWNISKSGYCCPVEVELVDGIPHREVKEVLSVQQRHARDRDDLSLSRFMDRCSSNKNDNRNLN